MHTKKNQFFVNSFDFLHLQHTGENANERDDILRDARKTQLSGDTTSPFGRLFAFALSSLLTRALGEKRHNTSEAAAAYA